MTTHIIDFSCFGLAEYKINRFGMILHIQPVPYIFSVSIHRQLFAIKRVVNHERNQFLRKLERSIIIRAPGDICRESIRIHICLYKKISRCFTGRIRTMRIQRGCLVKIAFLLRQRAIHFIRRDLKIPFPRQKFILFLPVRSGCLQKIQRSKHVCLCKNLRIADAPVYMAFRCKMHHIIHIIFFKYCFQLLTPADICLFKMIITSLFHRLQICQITCISKRIYIDHFHCIFIFFK